MLIRLTVSSCRKHVILDEFRKLLIHNQHYSDSIRLYWHHRTPGMKILYCPVLI